MKQLITCYRQEEKDAAYSTLSPGGTVFSLLFRYLRNTQGAGGR